jgi:hypothetical protein
MPPAKPQASASTAKGKKGHDLFSGPVRVVADEKYGNWRVVAPEGSKVTPVYHESKLKYAGPKLRTALAVSVVLPWEAMFYADGVRRVESVVDAEAYIARLEGVAEDNNDQKKVLDAKFEADGTDIFVGTTLFTDDEEAPRSIYRDSTRGVKGCRCSRSIERTVFSRACDRRHCARG